MKKLFTLIILSFAGNYLIAQEKHAANAQVIDKTAISEEESELIYEKSKGFPNNTQIAIAMIDEGEVYFYGVKRVNDSLRSVQNEQSVFEIGSISKVFTSTLLANSVIDQQLALDDPINKFAKTEIKSKQEISFKSLANHTSGLPRLPSNLNLFLADPQNPYKDYDAELLESYLKEDIVLAQDPGEKYAYSNLGAGLIGYLLSKKEGMTYAELLQAKIFSKYEMSSSTLDRSQVEQKLIKGLNQEGEEVSNWDFDVLAGAGGILSSVSDLSKFAIAQFDDSNTELALTRKKTFTVNKNMDMGLGWHIIKTKSGDELHWHNGGTGGYTSSIAIDVEKNRAIIILSNVSAFNKAMGNIDQLCFELMESLKAN